MSFRDTYRSHLNRRTPIVAISCGCSRTKPCSHNVKFEGDPTSYLMSATEIARIVGPELESWDRVVDLESGRSEKWLRRHFESYHQHPRFSYGDLATTSDSYYNDLYRPLHRYGGDGKYGGVLGNSNPATRYPTTQVRIPKFPTTDYPL